MALYLKYRPQTFSDFVGQDFIKKTLQAAVAEDKTVGAYMFTGPRGTGKTSTARILAKAINCTNSQNGDPCGTCEICRGFADESLVDIIEIDAASHTGVDNIREIIEKAQFQPTHTKYKVYIIDEVHMLSKGAFNALLKILEEPPEHIKFILATTEIHKVPDTILSRCQRYDFKNFTSAELRSRLEHIAKEEKIQVDDASYEYIIASAEGGMRNAVSLFEQLIHDGKIEYSSIVETLGISSLEQKQAFIDKLLSRDSSLLEDIETLKNEGKNLKYFLKELAYEMQDVAVKKIASGADISRDIEIIEQLSHMLTQAKNSFDEYFVYKTGLLKLLQGESTPQNTVPKVQKSPQQNHAQKVNPQKQELPSQNQKSQEETLVEETLAIFDTPKVEKVSQENVSQTSEQYFSKEVYIVELKKLKAKVALVMSIQGSTLREENEQLIITPKTKISYNTLVKTENVELLLQAAQNIQADIMNVKVVEHVL